MGFVGVGKLIGTHRGELFQKMILSFVEKHIYNVNTYSKYEENQRDFICAFPDELLTRIVTDLAIGLLVPSAALPLDSVVNHAVYLWLMNEFFWEEHLEAEMEEQSMEERDNDSSWVCHERTPEETAEEMERLFAVGAVGDEEDRRDRKALKKATKKAKLKNADSETLADVCKSGTTPNGSSATGETPLLPDHVNAYLKSANEIFNEKNKTTKTPKPKPVDLEKEWYFSYRILFRKVLAESHLGIGRTAMYIPPVRCKDTNRWRTALSMLLSGPTPLIVLPEKSVLFCDLNDFENQNSNTSTMYALARKEIIRQHVSSAAHLFEARWTKGTAMFCFRCLQLLSGFGMAENEKILILRGRNNLTCTNYLKVLDDTNHPEHVKSKAALLATKTADACGEEYTAEQASGQVDFDIEMMRHSAFCERVHLYARKEQLALDSDLDFFYQAIRFASSENEDSFTENSFVNSGAWLLKHPTETRMERERKKHEGRCEECGTVALRKSLKRCSGCNISYYCSVRCQKLAWKVHKKRCLMMREMMMTKGNKKKEKEKEKEKEQNEKKTKKEKKKKKKKKR
jgi:hypothetical protein